MKNLLASLLFFATFQAFGQIQTEVKSIFIEYAYDIPAGDEMALMMFGNNRLRVYADADFWSVANDVELPEEQIKLMGPGLKTKLIRENASGKLYLCATLDTIKIKTLQSEEKAEEVVQQFNLLNDPEVVASPKTSDEKMIATHPCHAFELKGKEEGMVSVTVYFSNDLKPAATLKSCPIAVSRAGKFEGFMLGNDQGEPFNSKLRAKNIELNASKNMAAELQTYRSVTDEEANKIIGEYMMNLGKK